MQPARRRGPQRAANCPTSSPAASAPRSTCGDESCARPLDRQLFASPRQMPTDRDRADAKQCGDRRNRGAFELVHHDCGTPAGGELLERAPHERFRDERAFVIRSFGSGRAGFAFGIDSLLGRTAPPLVALKVDEHAPRPPWRSSAARACIGAGDGRRRAIPTAAPRLFQPPAGKMSPSSHARAHWHKRSGGQTWWSDGQGRRAVVPRPCSRGQTGCGGRPASPAPGQAGRAARQTRCAREN